MKLQDIDNLQKYVDEIKLISDKLDYNTSSAINKCITKIAPLIKDERNRLESSNVDIDFPKLKIFTNREAKEHKMTVQDYMNYNLRELVINQYKIIDFGKLDEEYEDDNSRTIYMYIKYTS